jgi:hypothetical protein
VELFFPMVTSPLISIILIFVVTFLEGFDNFDALCFHFSWAGCVALFMYTGFLLELQYISKHNSQFATDRQFVVI